VANSALAGGFMGWHSFNDQLAVGKEAIPSGSKTTMGDDLEHIFLGIPLSFSRSHLLSLAHHGHPTFMGS
jgi:hypothetical protein